MNRMFFSFIINALLFSCLFVSCDDGKIYDEGKHVEIEGGIARVTATIQGVQTWPSDYTIVVAGFKKDDEYAAVAKTVTTADDGSMDLILKVFQMRSAR